MSEMIKDKIDHREIRLLAEAATTVTLVDVFMERIFPAFLLEENRLTVGDTQYCMDAVVAIEAKLIDPYTPKAHRFFERDDGSTDKVFEVIHKIVRKGNEIRWYSKEGLPVDKYAALRTHVYSVLLRRVKVETVEYVPTMIATPDRENIGNLIKQYDVLCRSLRSSDEAFALELQRKQDAERINENLRGQVVNALDRAKTAENKLGLFNDTDNRPEQPDIDPPVEEKDGMAPEHAVQEPITLKEFGKLVNAKNLAPSMFKCQTLDSHRAAIHMIDKYEIKYKD